MKYKATVHTLEIEPLLPETVSNKKWIEWMNRSRFAYARWPHEKNGNELRVIINPHKTERLSNGLFHFEYDGLTRHKEIMNNICKELDMNGYIIRRFDVCLDTDQPYEHTAKLTRLITLLLGDEIKANNCYFSIDPLTFKSKTMRIQKDDKKTYELQAEHYNRAVIDQSEYDTTVCNRFELRATGAEAGENHDERGIVEKWIERLQNLETADLSGLESRLNAGIFSMWETYAQKSGKPNCDTDFNYFLRFMADHIYTQGQMKDLCRLFGKKKPSKTASDLKQRSGELFKSLFTRREIRLATKEMIEALTGFISS